MREVGYTSTKLLSVRVRSFCQSMWETRSESAHGHWLKRATLGIHCSSASTGGYQTVLPYCARPLLDWGELPVFAIMHRTERFEYMYRATPNIYIYIYIYIKNTQHFEHIFEKFIQCWPTENTLPAVYNYWPTGLTCLWCGNRSNKLIWDWTEEAPEPFGTAFEQRHGGKTSQGSKPTRHIQIL